MIRRTIRHLNEGNYALALATFSDGATLAFPGDNSWANQHRPTQKSRESFATHRGRAEIEDFLRRYVDAGIQMEVEDILVNGPPWNTRAAVRVRDWALGPDGQDVYNNRAVLFVNSSWGRIHRQEDYEDTERAAAFDAVINRGASARG
jgi:hypothetical protein